MLMVGFGGVANFLAISCFGPYSTKAYFSLFKGLEFL